jgi:hypothetical protein
VARLDIPPNSKTQGSYSMARENCVSVGLKGGYRYYEYVAARLFVVIGRYLKTIGRGLRK